MAESSRLRVLLIEDSEDDAQLFVRELEGFFHDVAWERVETAPAMRAALERRPWDLVLADYSLPQFSAPEALRLLQETGLDLPFLIVSGSVGEETAIKLMRAGAHDFLLKGSLKRLMPAVERELEQAGQRRARRQAEEHNRLLAAIVDSSDDAIISTDLAGNIVSWNQGAERMYGYTASEMKGQAVFRLEPRERRGEVGALLESLRSEGRLRRYESVRERKDGTRLEVAVSLFPIGDVSSGIVGAASIARDITERKEAEEALRQSEERYRSLIESSRDVITVIDPQGMIRFASPSMERVGGYRPEEVLEKDAFLYVHPEDAARLKARLAEILTRETPTVPIAFRFRHKDGSWKVFEAVGNNRVSDPQVGGIVLNSRDVTEIQRAEDALRQSEERFRRSFFASPVAMTLSEPKTGIIIDANEGVANMLGYRPEELIGHSALALGLWADPSERARLVADIGAGTPVREREVHFRTKTGEVRLVLDSVEPLQFGEERLLLSAFQDFTERKRLEEQLRQAQKMEAVGQLAGGVAHDFNNLLMTILGYGDFLLQRLKPDDPLRGDVEEIKKAGERAAALTRQLLAFSRKQVLDLVLLDLNGVVTELEKMLRRLIGEDVTVVTVLDSEPCLVKADAGQIDQVILNLAVNGRDAMPRGGKLTIEARRVELDAAYAAEHPYALPGPYVMLAVADTGEGIDAATKSHIFEPFFTTKPQGKGTGLGLSMVYGIVKQSGGSIEVESQPGRGTTFRIYLPRVCGPVERSPQPVRTATVGGNETVLLVEDETAVRVLARRILEIGGYAVIEAQSPEDAVEIGKRHSGPLHLMVTDTVMPGLSGPQLAELLLTLRPRMKVLFVSGYADAAIIHHGPLKSHEAFLQKPFGPDVLLRRVREILDVSKS